MAFSKQWSANQQESITKKSPENLMEVTPSLIMLLPHPSMYTYEEANKLEK